MNIIIGLILFIILTQAFDNLSAIMKHEKYYLELLIEITNKFL